MSIDLAAVYAGQISYTDLMRTMQHADLHTMTNDFFATLEAILAHTSDAAVGFVPRDPSAEEPEKQGWTISHIIAHLTATLEEAAAVSAMLARGVLVEARLRYETPWQELITASMVRARLRESQRICRAFLDAWPDEPHLDVTRTLIPHIGPMSAPGFYVFGFVHAQSHLDQLRETVRQYDELEGKH